MELSDNDFILETFIDSGYTDPQGKRWFDCKFKGVPSYTIKWATFNPDLLVPGHHYKGNIAKVHGKRGYYDRFFLIHYNDKGEYIGVDHGNTVWN